MPRIKDQSWIVLVLAGLVLLVGIYALLWGNTPPVKKGVVAAANPASAAKPTNTKFQISACTAPFNSPPQRRISVSLIFDTDVGLLTSEALEKLLDLPAFQKVFSRFGIDLSWSIELRDQGSPFAFRGVRPLNLARYEGIRYRLRKGRDHTIYVLLADVAGEDWMPGVEGKNCKSDNDCLLGFNPRIGGWTSDALTFAGEDVVPRDDVVLFLGSIRNLSKRLGLAEKTLATRDLAHEISHTLNLYHEDGAEGSEEDPRYSIERSTAPTKTPFFGLTGRSVAHLLTSEERYILPGSGNFRFDWDDYPDMNFRKCVPEPEATFEGPSGRVQRSTNGLPSKPVAATFSRELIISARPLLKRALIGTPILLWVSITNPTHKAVERVPLAWAESTLVKIEYRFQGDKIWRPWHSVNGNFETFGHSLMQIRPQASVARLIPIYLGTAGWTFPNAGLYEVRASIKVGSQQEDWLPSAVAQVQIVEASSARDVGAHLEIADSDGKIPWDVALFFESGADGLERAKSASTKVSHDYSETALGKAAAIALNFSRRGKITAVQDACILSLVSRAGNEVYSNRTLFEPSSAEVRFETDSYEISPLEKQRLSVFLTGITKNRKMILVVEGNADSRGTCIHNDILSDRRAEAVARELSRNLDQSSYIYKVELIASGSRHPVDNQSTAEAYEENRRARIHLRYE